MQTNILLFPPELNDDDVLDTLHDLNVRAKTQPRLRTFFTSSSDLLHELVVALDDNERAEIGPFADILDLAEKTRHQNCRAAAVEVVLLIFIQVSQLLV